MDSWVGACLPGYPSPSHKLHYHLVGLLPPTTKAGLVLLEGPGLMTTQHPDLPSPQLPATAGCTPVPRGSPLKSLPHQGIPQVSWALTLRPHHMKPSVTAPVARDMPSSQLPSPCLSQPLLGETTPAPHLGRALRCPLIRTEDITMAEPSH